MKSVELIIFDLDGTLVDSKEGIANSVNLALKEVGVSQKSNQEIISYIGIGVDHLIRTSLGKEYEHLFEKTKSVFENYRRSSLDGSKPYPGVEEILDYFKNKKKVIVTNGKREFALLTLKRCNIYNYFADVIGGDELDCMKPSSCPLDAVMAKFNMNKEKACHGGRHVSRYLSRQKSRHIDLCCKLWYR